MIGMTTSVAIIESILTLVVPRLMHWLSKVRCRRKGGGAGVGTSADFFYSNLLGAGAESLKSRLVLRAGMA